MTVRGKATDRRVQRLAVGVMLSSFLSDVLLDVVQALGDFVLLPHLLSPQVVRRAGRVVTARSLEECILRVSRGELESQQMEGANSHRDHASCDRATAIQDLLDRSDQTYCRRSQGSCTAESNDSSASIKADQGVDRKHTRTEKPLARRGNQLEKSPVR